MKKLLKEFATVLAIQILGEERLTEQQGAISAWTAPIWNIGKLNLNGRVYPEELAKRIVAENKATLSYDSHNHPWGEAYKEAVAVTKNPRIENDQLWVDIFFVEKAYSEKIASIYKAGVPIGVSSVGYGETDKDGVVNASTYELVRYLDFVTAPANETVAEPTKEKKDEQESDESAEVIPDSTLELSEEEMKRRIEILKKVEAIG